MTLCACWDPIHVAVKTRAIAAEICQILIKCRYDEHTRLSKTLTNLPDPKLLNGSVQGKKKGQGNQSNDSTE